MPVCNYSYLTGFVNHYVFSSCSRNCLLVWRLKVHKLWYCTRRIDGEGWAYFGQPLRVTRHHVGRHHLINNAPKRCPDSSSIPCALAKLAAWSVTSPKLMYTPRSAEVLCIAAASSRNGSEPWVAAL